MSDDAECPDTRAAYHAVWARLEASRSRIDETSRAQLLLLPAPVVLALQRISPEPAAVREEVREAQRLALLEGRWDAYEETLRARARSHATLGVEAGDWLRAMAATRDVLVDATFAAGLDSGALRRELRVIDEFFHRITVTMTRAYVDAKQDHVRRAEARLQLYIDAFEACSMGMVVYVFEAPHDPVSFRLTIRNDAAVRANPVFSDGVGKRLDELVPPELAREVGANWVRVMQTGRPSAWERRGAHDGRWYAVRAYPLPDSHLCLLFEDVSDEHQLRDQLAQQVAELERSNRDLDEFAYVTSHDLRSPLADVRHLAQWVVEDSGDALSASSRRHLELLRQRSERMERLLDGLLEYARVGHGVQAPQDFTFGSVVSEVLAVSSLPAGSQVEVRGEEVALHGPRAPLEKILRNVVANAVKHHDRAQVRLELSAELAGDRARIAITDDGPGIPREYHERVFEMFETLRPRDEVEASGIGLAIVKKAVEHHGGRVTIESEGRGTSIRFDWPREWPRPGGAVDERA